MTSLKLFNTSDDVSDDESSLQVDGFDGVHNDPEFFRVVNIFGTYINTIISVLGIIGNIISTIVLRRSGLRKSSNILLWALAVGDMLFLIGQVNFSGRIYNAGNPRGWYGHRSLGYFLFVVWQLHSNCYLIGHFVSMIIPALITTERLIATLYPLKFKQIATPKRVWISVVVCFMIGMTYSLFESSVHLIFHYAFFSSVNATFGVLAIRPKSPEMWATRDMIKKVFFFFEGIVPIAYVTVGCVVISFNIKAAAKKRKEISSTGSDKKSKTTMMLISVCIVYVISCSFYTIVRLFPEGPMVYRVMSFGDTLLTINSSVNPIIYVVFNKNFRDLYLAVILFRAHNPTTKEGM